MIQYILLADIASDFAEAASNGINWAISVATFVVAITMAISLLSWLFNRSL